MIVSCLTLNEVVWKALRFINFSFLIFNFIFLAVFLGIALYFFLNFIFFKFFNILKKFVMTIGYWRWCKNTISFLYCLIYLFLFLIFLTLFAWVIFSAALTSINFQARFFHLLSFWASLERRHNLFLSERTSS
jgi:hypothetical protein